MLRGGEPGADRLALLAEADSDAISAFWDRAGLQEGADCLDLGCGSGAVSVSLAGRVGRSGSVLALDRDPEALAVARRRADAAGLTNIEFAVCDAYDLVASERFDFAYSRLLLHHLARPAEVLRRMWTALRPGGRLAVDDADFDGAFCYPANDGFDFWRERYSAVVGHHGGDATLGRKLVRLFVEAGLPLPSVHVTQRLLRDGPTKQIPVLTLQESADAMIDAGVATRQEVDAAVATLAAFAADPTTIYAGPRHIEAWAQKESDASR